MNENSGRAKLRLMTVVGTRPEIIKLSEIIRKCDRYFEQILVHTGQNYDYELNEVFFSELGLRKPDHFLDAAGDNVGETMGRVIERSYQVMEAERPDAVLVLGDTNSCLCVISAKRLKIPVFHMEAGNRCKDENLPEEVIRRIVDVTSDVNLCYSEEARRNILGAGVRPEYTFVVGSPMREILSRHAGSIRSSDVLRRLGLEEKGYILLSAHREENIDDESNFRSLVSAINAAAEAFDMPVLYSCHPRAEKMIERRDAVFDSRVRRHKPLGFTDYNRLQKSSFCVISDSGTLPEESAFYRAEGEAFPAVSIRTSTERQEAVQEGAFLLSGVTPEGIVGAIRMAVEMCGANDLGGSVPSYACPDVSSKVVKLIQSYTGVINDMVWRKTR